MVVALGAADLARRPSSGCPGRRARRRPRRAATSAPPARAPVRSRSWSAASTPYAPYIPESRSAIGTPTRCGSSGPAPVSDIRPGLALRDLVVAGPAALGAVVPEAGDRQHHQPRVALQQRLDAEAEPLEHAGAEVLHEHVGPVDQPQQHVAVAAVGVLEVERDRLLVAVGRQEVRRLARLAHERRPPAAGVVAVAGRLDLDHPGAEVAEHLGRVRSGQGAGQVDDDGACERSPVLIRVTTPGARARPRPAAVRPASRSRRT